MVAPPSSPLQTEFEFSLPKGYLDSTGVLHRDGRMRLATAMDEIAPQRDPRVRSNQAYLTVAILSRVVTSIGALPEVTTEVIEGLFAADLAYLQDLYRKINSDGDDRQIVTCPSCDNTFEVRRTEPGEVVGYPLDELFEEVAFVAYHFHWSLDEILRLEHGDRQRLIEEISAINRRANAEPSPAQGIPLEQWR